ncbi:DUF5060 domain-containing protein [bacterium]|nr:DUF5060 domain-containing protein [bacterium]
MRIGRLIAITLFAAAAVRPAAGGAAALKRWRFEYDTEGWTSSDSTLAWSADRAAEGGYGLKLDVAFPQPATMLCPVNFDVDLVGSVSYNVFVPKDKDAPESVKALLFLKDKDGLWFQHFVEQPIPRGAWHTVKVDISSSSPQLRPSGHHAQWSSIHARRIIQLGLKFFCDEPYTGTLHVDDIVAERAARPTQPLRVINLRESAPETGRYEKFEVTFEINRDITNPFDPDHIRIDATFEDAKKTRTVPAFYHQDFVRRIVNDREELTHVGRGVWKVRYAPVVEGPHTYYLTVHYTPDRRTGGDVEQLVTGKRKFVCIPSDDPGFIRVSKKAPFYFEFDNGKWFYPIGHNLHSPSDDTPRAVAIQKHIGKDILPNHGTVACDYLFQRMAENGENFAEVWMCTWWLGLEWLADWRHYNGLNNYNLLSAWRLDYLMGLAKEKGIYLHLTLDNHGKASTWTDPEWEDNPYNELNGGFLKSPEEWFRNPIAKEIYKKKLRYLIARWGYATQLAGIELWSEIDLVGDSWDFHSNDVQAAPKVQWHRDMTQYLGRIDPWQHLVTTHFSTNYGRIKSTLATLPGIKYNATDAYSRPTTGLVKAFIATAEKFNSFGKPGIVTEYGGSPFGSAPGPLRSDLHAGLWSTYMTHTAGTPMLWWHQFIESDDLYWNFKALAAYHEGEDRRGQGFALQRPVITTGASDLLVLSLQNPTQAYVWVYSAAMAASFPKKGAERTYEGALLRLAALQDGKYRVEVWDTYKGGCVKQFDATTQDSTLSIKLPTFKSDCALKVKPIR